MPELSNAAIDHFRAEHPPELMTGWFYHGSPVEGMLEGMLEVRRSGMFIPNEHAELNAPLLSVSRNQEVLHLFSDSNSDNGFSFDLKDFNVVRLNPMYSALAASEATGDWWDEYAEKTPGALVLAEKLGLITAFGYPGLENGAILRLLPDDIDGVVLPSWENQSLRSEQELAVTPRGCEKLLSALDSVSIDGEYYDEKRGWERLEALAALPDAIPELCGRGINVQAATPMAKKQVAL